MASSPKKKPRVGGADQGGAPGQKREARDPMVQFGWTDDAGQHFGGMDRASALNIDPKDVSPLNSPARKAARAAADAKFDRTLDDRLKRKRQKAAGGMFGGGRY